MLPRTTISSPPGGRAFATILAAARASPYAVWSGVVFLLAGYLCLVNLNYVGFWHDEAPAAFIGKMLLQQGDIIGWDGRNLVGGTNGRTLNDDLRDTLPPLTYLLNAAGYAIAGINETGARLPHAIAGVVALLFFYLLLRQFLPAYPRLVFILFSFSALSAQLLMFFRQSRYYAVMVLTLVLMLYLYEHYWRTKKPVYLAALAVAAMAAFFNHYAASAAAILSLATYHLIFRANQTSGREWAMFFAAGFLVAAVGLAYFYWLGIIGGERSGGFLAYTGLVVNDEYLGTTPYWMLKIYIYFRETFVVDWVSWPVLLWFVGFWVIQNKPTKQKRRQKQRQKKHQPQLPSKNEPFLIGGKLVLFGALFVLFSALLTVQPLWTHPIADIRYYVAALPFLLVMKGLLVEWLWQWKKSAGWVALFILALTNIAAAPYNIKSLVNDKSTLGMTFFQFATEIHRPYPDPATVTADYLLNNAKKDALVYVQNFPDREMLTFYAGDYVRFCCHLNADSRVTAALNTPLSADTTPEWIVSFGDASPPAGHTAAGEDIPYVLAANLSVYHYPTQRPEIMFHAFTPPPGHPGVFIWKQAQ